MMVGEADPKVTSPLTMVSADFQKIGVNFQVRILMLVTLPTLQPSKLKKMSLVVTAIFTLGFVILTIFSMRLSPLFSYFSAVSEGFSTSYTLPTPSENTSPFIIDSGYTSTCWPPQLLERIEGYLEAPQAQSTKLPTFPISLSSQSGPASTQSSYLLSLAQKRTISATSAQMPKSSTLELSLCFCAQLQEMAGLPSCTQIAKSMAQVRKRQCRLFTAAERLHSALSPTGKSFSTFMFAGWVYAMPFAYPDGLASGRKIVLATLRRSYELSRMEEPAMSSPLSPARRRTVRLVLFWEANCLSSDIKQCSQHGDWLHISPSAANCLRENAESLGTFSFQILMIYQQLWGPACASQVTSRRVINNFIL